MEQAILDQMLALAPKSYDAKENYKLVKEIGTVVVDHNNRVQADSNGKGHSLRVLIGDKAIFIALRKGVPMDKKAYTVAEFEAAEEFTFSEVTVEKGAKKMFAY